MMQKAFLFGMLDKKEKHQRILEKKILNAKIFEYHKDMKQFDSSLHDEKENKNNNE